MVFGGLSIIVYFHKYTKLARFGEKVVDVNEICDIILCSAIKIPEQSYHAQYRTGGGG